MTKRNIIASEQNIWYNSQQVDNDDLSLEQDHNDIIQSGIINNHIGSGILPEVLTQNIIFDSILENGLLDGTAIYTQNQPADNNLGNQLELILTDSKATINKTIKVCIIGLDFESQLQYETFYFKCNETQISKRHFAKVLLFLFNDFIGPSTISLNLGGRLIVKEVKPMSLSRCPIMVAQDIEPNLFFRDFFVYSGTITNAIDLIADALPTYNTSTLDIFVSELDNKILLNGDVTTQIGQKFIASTNNIQKIQLLLSVRNSELGQETDLAWNGDLIVSVYPLQSNIECPSDIAPNLAIDFSPSNIPLAQISVNYSTLLTTGTVLDSVPQLVDFVFSNSSLASGNILTIGNYYAFTIKRSGSANKCDILISAGNDRVIDSRITTFTGSLWVDIPEQDLWFRIYTDSAKVSDGQSYEAGHGIIIPKTNIDSNTQLTIDYSMENLQFTGNEVYRAVVAADVKETNQVPDQRTGEPVYSRKEFVPNIKLLNTIDITNLESTSEPLLIGAIADKNRKYFNAISSTINSSLHSATIVNDEIFIRIIDDATDLVRYDTSVNSLVINLLNGDLAGAQIIPNLSNSTTNYRIASATLLSNLVGDVNGDGIIDSDDLDLLSSYYGYNLNTGLPESSLIVQVSGFTSFTNGYKTYINKFEDNTGINFQIVDPITTAVIASGSDGVLVADPNNNRLANFTSSSILFNTIIGLSSYKLVISDASPSGNCGGFDIISLDSINDTLTIRKVFLDSDVMMQMLRSDIDGDFSITTDDGYLLESYIDRLTLNISHDNTFPGPTTNPFTKIGTRFNVIRLKLEKFIDRSDDYISSNIDRSTLIHPIQDIFLNDGYYDTHNYYSAPVAFSIRKQLTWDESLIVSNSDSKLVPSVFTSLNGFSNIDCNIDGVNVNLYGSKPTFDKGRIDVFVPDNLIIGDGGQLHRPDGNFYKVDFEVGTIVLEIPNGLFGSEKTINVLDDFIADYTGDGRTRLGFPSMKFADCSLVSADALANDQIRLSVAVQSFSPNTNGISEDGYSGAIVDGKIGVSIDYQTGLLTLNFTNLYQDTLLSTLSTKIQVHVYLKKGGFNNKPLFVDSVKVQNMLNLISVFSGIEGGPSALVNIEADVSGILPIIHGGTGLNDVGVIGTVLTSTGSGLNYQFMYDLPEIISFNDGSSSSLNRIVKTDGYGKLDPSLMYKNPVYIYGVSGNQTHNTNTPSSVGAFSFRFDKYILEGLDSIKLEVILQTNNGGDAANVALYDITNTAYIPLDGVTQELTTLSITPVLLISSDIKILMLEGATDFIYEIHIYDTSNVGIAICKMARLVMTYNNPATMPTRAHSSNFVPYLASPTPI
ncbi:hypothetical protein UFOVP1290_28 [uncultured Caudovirales phage]|uniref:Dockerin domain-containing protein n=1 Tax=uncultured Caudovirales phage TaxID=2100421 RepID=A0A6J5RS54_9CAUD|nr:hypothetical protein UFOVP1290_28 [uncultured Caudovirales phage]